MGFRFRKSIRIAPGIRLNLSKSGVSTSIGARGATINVSKRGVRGTVGLPGTGLSYSDMLVKGSDLRSGLGSEATANSSSARRIIIFLAIGAGIFFLLLLLGTGGKTTEQQRSASRAATSPVQSKPELSSGGTTVTMAAVNCRSGPDKRAGVVRSVPADTQVSVVAVQGKWSRITDGPAECWVSTDYLG